MDKNPKPAEVTCQNLRQTAYMVREFSRVTHGGQQCVTISSAWVLAIVEKCLTLMEEEKKNRKQVKVQTHNEIFDGAIFEDTKFLRSE